MPITGILGGYNEQRAAGTNYLTALDQMRRAQIAQQLEAQRQQAQQNQFGQELAQRQAQAQQTAELERARMAAQQQQFGQEFGLRAQEQGIRGGEFGLKQQEAARTAQGRNALQGLLSQPGEIDTAALGRAVLPYDTGTGIGLIKAAKEEQIQKGLLQRTGGTGVSAPQGYRWTQEGNLEFIPGGGADPEQVAALSESRKSAQEKALPATAAQKLIENSQNLRRAEQALALVQGKEVSGIQGDVAATGWKGYAPQSLLNRFDPTGADTRAALADLGSMVLHERSGAAVTAAEEPRLRPFIPSVTDDQATIQKKLARFKQVYSDLIGDTADFYKESGYKVPSEVFRHAEVTGQGKGGGQTQFNSLPDPRQYSGKTVRDTETGARWTSNGSDWRRAQ